MAVNRPSPRVWPEDEVCLLQLKSLATCAIIIKDLKNIKNVKRCRDGMPKSMQTR